MAVQKMAHLSASSRLEIKVGRFTSSKILIFTKSKLTQIWRRSRLSFRQKNSLLSRRCNEVAEDETKASEAE